MRLPAVLTIAALLPAVGELLDHLRRGYTLSLFETGTLLAGGDHMLHGERLYSDVFAFYGPLAYLYPTVCARLIGDSVWAFLLPDLFLGMLSGIVAYRLAFQICQRPLIALAAPLLTAFQSGNGIRTLPALAAVLAISTASDQTRNRRLGLAGVATGINLLWWQDGGVWIAVAIAGTTIGLAVVRRSWTELLQRLGAWSAGVLLVLTPWGAYLIARGDLGNWFFYCFVFPNAQYTRRPAFEYMQGVMRSWSDDSLPKLAYHASFYLAPYVFALAIAVVATAVSALRLRRWKSERGYWLTIVSLYTLLQLRVLFASVDESKLASVFPAVIVLAFLPLGSASGASLGARKQRTMPSLTSLMAIAPLAYVVLFGIQSHVHGVLHSSTPHQYGATVLRGFALAGANPPATTVSDVETVVRWMTSHSRAGDRVLVLPDQPTLYFLADRDAAVRFDYLDPTYFGAEQDGELVRMLAARPPALIVLADSTFANTGLHGHDMAPTTYSWIDSAYAVDQRVGSFTLLLRKTWENLRP